MGFHYTKRPNTFERCRFMKTIPCYGNSYNSKWLTFMMPFESGDHAKAEMEHGRQALGNE